MGLLEARKLDGGDWSPFTSKKNPKVDPRRWGLWVKKKGGGGGGGGLKASCLIHV